jgi:cytochrome b
MTISLDTINPTLKSVRVWDLPLRIFHWGLLLTVIGLFVTAKIGGNAMQWHFYFGYTAMTLLAFRLVWGVMGSQYARFSSFPPNPAAAWRTVRGAASASLGHNPLGAFSVYAFLVSLSFQAISGLFSNDDIAAQGPWAVKISKEQSDTLTGLHKINEKVIIALIALHLVAMLYYHFVKKEPLLKAMVTGDKQMLNHQPALDNSSTRWRGLSVFLACALLVYWLVKKP